MAASKYFLTEKTGDGIKRKLVELNRKTNTTGDLCYDQMYTVQRIIASN